MANPEAKEGIPLNLEQKGQFTIENPSFLSPEQIVRIMFSNSHRDLFLVKSGDSEEDIYMRRGELDCIVGRLPEDKQAIFKINVYTAVSRSTKINVGPFVEPDIFEDFFESGDK